MANVLKESKLTIESAVVAYLLAITSAAIVSPAIGIIVEIMHILWSSGFDVDAVFGLLGKPQYRPIYLGIEVVAVWVLGFISAILPYALCITVARHLKILQWQYFVLCGVAIAVFPFYIFISFLNQDSTMLYPGSALWWHYVRELPKLVVCGAIAGVASWLYLRRNFVRQEFGNIGEST